ncbi:asparagine synthase (glutamine-hydrolyzing) [Pollutimonas bauzanensis]|uniref:asparagine synthase (glutamine-hydrolyzing) n=1 Tax=Pollutimonas bauzanensis TaxID=658167 RepID=A0A1M5PTK0_9BURK|nr:asparagine synthase (glutamine-hydrolyzing) [Pollutimonas bauzanensis]SHH05032.1 asparagine synthase (glutamine-hydrolysing) [Pollutimonas bauzanensis]
MCGIVGIWGALPDKRAVVGAGCRSLRHRGPDSEGYWEDQQAGLALGHVRLAILDLTEAGHQPMISACGRYALVLNGEIYNHLELRADLQAQGHAPAWRGHSDTETILAGFAAWGVQSTLQAAVGMFAMALWDRQERTLTLMRDRMGEKPLYMGFVAGNFVFASELKALTGIPGFNKEPDRKALSLLVRHNYIPAPFSIYSAIRKLEPGSWLQLSQEQRQHGALPLAQRYWSAREVARQARGNSLSFGSDGEAVQALETVLASAVKGQMISDVDLGAFLSGGIDSSIVVALMQKDNAQAVKTFSIGFNEPAYNEAEHAKAVAAHLGTDHTELYVSAGDALAVVPGLGGLYDEPFADSSQIPTILVTRMARRHVTVALSGDGGDELFGGYSRYFRASRWWDKRASIPAPLRGPMAAAARLGAGWLAAGRAGEQFDKLAQVLAADHSGKFYQQFVSYWKDPAQVVIGADIPATAFDEPSDDAIFERMMLLDALTYLPDDILVKVDRAAMAASLETRVPMIDHRVFEFAQRLPRDYKIRDGQGKWLLRQLLYKHVPRQMVDRPKKGFSVPLAAWLRGPLRDWAAALLDPARLRQQGLFHAEPIVRKWQEHQAGKRDWSTHLWSILMTQAWLEHNSAAGAGHS